MSKRILASTFMVVALTAPGSAQGTQFGAQVMLAIPGSDLGTYVGKKMGFGAGLHLQFDLGGGHAIVPRLEFAQFSGTSDDFFGAKPDTTAKFVSLFADYRYYISGRTDTGFFFGGGLGASKAFLDAKLGGRSASAEPVSPAIALALGYGMTRSTAVELRITSATASNIEWDTSYGWVTLKEDRTSLITNLVFHFRF